MNKIANNRLVVLGLYIAITLLMTWPVVALITSHVAGSGGDPWQTLWRFEEKSNLGFDGFLGDALGQGEARLINLSVWPWMWLQLIFGQPVTYNLVWLLSFVLGGYGMFLLTGWLMTEYKAAAFLAGLFYMFLPFHTAHAFGHFGAMQIQWLPFILLIMFSFLRKPTWWKALVGVVLVLMQAWTEHHYALWLLIFGLLFAVFYRDKVADAWRQPRGKLWMASGLGLATILVLMSYWPTLILASKSPESLVLGQEQTIRFSADLFSWVTPAGWHPIWGGLSSWLSGQHFTGNFSEATHYLGLAPLLFVLFFVKSVSRKHRLFWLSVAGVFFLFALGPRLHILGRVVPLSLPYALIDSWPVFDSVRTVGRAGIMIGIAMAVLFGFVCREQLKGKMVVIAMGLVVLLEFLLVPVPMQSARLSPVYQAVADKAGSVLIEIPASTNYVLASRSLYASRIHGKKVLGNIALERGAKLETEDIRPNTLPALRQIMYFGINHLNDKRLEFFRQDMVESLADVLKWVDAEVLVLHTDSVSAPQLAALRSYLESEVGVVPQDFGDALLYDLSMADAGDGVFLARDNGWENLSYEEASDEYIATIPEKATFDLVNTTENDLQVSMNFDLQGNLIISGEGGVVAEVAEGDHQLVEVILKPGVHKYEFRNRLTQPAVLVNPEFEVL